MQQAVKESARSAEVRAELWEQGYKIMWDVQQDLTRLSYATERCRQGDPAPGTRCRSEVAGLGCLQAADRRQQYRKDVPGTARVHERG
jgi:hypothetical protein